MLPAGVVGVIAVGVDGRVLRSAKAMVPFLARFIGHGVESGDGNPWIDRFKVPVPLPHTFVAVSVMLNVPGLVGMPVMFPLVVFKDKPWGRKLALKLSGLWFVLNRSEHGTPAAKTAFVCSGVKFGGPFCPPQGLGGFGVNAASMISLSSEGYVAASFRLGRVGRVKLAYVGNPPRLIFTNPPSSYTAKAYLPITAFGAGAESGP